MGLDTEERNVELVTIKTPDMAGKQIVQEMSEIPRNAGH